MFKYLVGFCVGFLLGVIIVILRDSSVYVVSTGWSDEIDSIHVFESRARNRIKELQAEMESRIPAGDVYWLERKDSKYVVRFEDYIKNSDFESLDKNVFSISKMPLMENQ